MKRIKTIIEKLLHKIKVLIFWAARIRWRWFFYVTDENWQLREKREYNLVPTVWLWAFASQFNYPTHTLWDELYIAIGSDPTTPASWDTTLWIETLRKVFSSKSSSWPIANVTTFFTAQEFTWTIQEAWLFASAGHIQATWTADTWVLISRVTDTINVWAQETLTIIFELTFTI